MFNMKNRIIEYKPYLDELIDPNQKYALSVYHNKYFDKQMNELLLSEVVNHALIDQSAEV